ncbi:MAG: hypothetical protein LBK99_23245 [Opitutaceae bacterium]|jgi:hypothetical protein|nr:hypothetical protein [Opitutaceae bacterium]
MAAAQRKHPVDVRLDRSILVKEPLAAQGNDAAWWRARPPLERLEAPECMRRLNYRNYDSDTSRLSRFHRPVKRPARQVSD